VLLRHMNEVEALCGLCAGVTLVGLLAGHPGCIGVAAGLLCRNAAWSDTARRVREVVQSRVQVVC